MTQKVSREDLQKRRDALAAECEDYAPRRNSHQCQHYGGDGTCKREDYFMCVVWMRKNPMVETKVQPKKKATAETPSTDAVSSKRVDALSAKKTPQNEQQHGSLKDQFLDQPLASSTPTRREVRDAEVYDLTRYGIKEAPPARPILDHPELLTEEAIAAVEKLGYEITVKTTAGVELTLVPAYTEQDRAELSYRDARTIVMVLQVFPGSTLAQITKPKQEKAS